jgi:predicted AAA+ superfamily ATPase
MYNRSLTQFIRSHEYSILLLGPRQTGKSTLLRSLDVDLEINLADENTFLTFSSDPDRLRSLLQALPSKKTAHTILIDEVQRIPSLLNTIQVLIDEKKNRYRFLLSGSSARKLRRGNANLLPGRVLSYSLGPLHVLETLDDRPVQELLRFGSLPGVVTEPNIQLKKTILTSYAATYLKEEIQAEALTKNIEGFSRFLFVAAAKNGEFLDYGKLGTQASISQKTASRFFEILEDTLIVRRLEAFAKTPQRRLIRHPKYYFFDVGVLNGLLGNFTASNDRIGNLFETLVFNQLSSLMDSRGITARFSSYRTTHGAEIDLILQCEESDFAIEVKASKNIGPGDLKALRAFQSEYPKFKSMIIYLGDHVLERDGIKIMSLFDALKWIRKEL